MPLIIENGTGVSGADSFVTVAECEAFALAWFGASLAGSPASKEAALRRAFGYMRSLQWCDSEAFPTFGGTIPEAVKDAQHIFARAEFQAVNALQPSVTRGQQKVLNRVGSIGWQVTGTAGVDAQRQTVTMAMDRLKGLLCGNGSVTFLDRA
jgi:hypothetical protein